MDDLALLREYAANNSEAAFAELVLRRVGFVYAAALRQVRDPHLAGEITQAVFIILAQKAGRISDKTILAGWLFKTTRFAAIAQTRAAAKRQQREQEVQMQTELQSATPDPLWEQMSPLLDEALASLGEKDRQAVLLRFFENKSLAEVGSNLGTGEDTARKRVSRALEKLHRYFSKRGVASTTVIIAGAMSANSVQAAPVMLAKSVIGVAIAKGAVVSGSTLILTKGALSLMAWTKVKTVIGVALGILLAAGTTTVVVKGILDDYLGDRDLNDFQKAPPMLAIQETHFSQNRFATRGKRYSDKAVGRNTSLSQAIADAYGFHTYRIIFPANMPATKIDFLVTVPDQPWEKFQAEIQKQFGFVGRREVRETDLLLLKLGSIGASKLRLRDDPEFNSIKQRMKHRLEISCGSFSNTAPNLENFCGKPVIDRTGLTNNYDIVLDWNWNGRPMNSTADLYYLAFKLTLTIQSKPVRDWI
jgi:uncharacterized protein (TIGR03435 family)